MKEELISFSILDRTYRLSAMPEQAETICSLARNIDMKARSFVSSFPKFDSQDYIAMAAVMVAMSLIKDNSSSEETLKEVNATLESINSLISNSQNQL